jgi:hypothetical protein
MTNAKITKLYDANHHYYQHYTKKNSVNYHGQRSMALKRNVEWNFTFDSWIKWWIDTGHFLNRGVRNNQYQMCRYNDTGAYSPDNVYCDLGSNNKQTFFDNNPEWKAGRKEHAKTIHIKRMSNPKWHEGRERIKKRIVAKNLITNEEVTFIGYPSLLTLGYTRYGIKRSIKKQLPYKDYLFIKQI